MTLAAVREAIDTCADTDPAVFARRARNALAAAILAESFGHTEPGAPSHEPPVADLRDRVGDDLSETLAAIYDGCADWPSRAIDALGPLHTLARG